MSIVSVLISLVVAFAVTAGLGFVIIPWSVSYTHLTLPTKA